MGPVVTFHVLGCTAYNPTTGICVLDEIVSVIVM